MPYFCGTLQVVLADVTLIKLNFACFSISCLASPLLILQCLLQQGINFVLCTEFFFGLHQAGVSPSPWQRERNAHPFSDWISGWQDHSPTRQVKHCY